MALMVSSIFSTWPCLTPLEFARPKPSISSLPYSFLRPAMAAILVVPMSSPTIMGCSWFMVCFNLLLFLMFIASFNLLVGFSRKIITPEVLLGQGISLQWFYFPDFCGILIHFLGLPDHIHNIFARLDGIGPRNKSLFAYCNHLVCKCQVDGNIFFKSRFCDHLFIKNEKAVKFIFKISSVSQVNLLVAHQGCHLKIFRGIDVQLLDLARPECILVQKGGQIPDLSVQRTVFSRCKFFRRISGEYRQPENSFF